MQPIQMLTKDEIAIWTWLVSKGIANALSGLSQMAGQRFSVTSLDIRQLPVKDAAMLLGGHEYLVVGTCQEIHGDATGYLMLMDEPRTAFQLIDLQLGLSQGSTQKIGEMERFVLDEIGNITGSFFLNALAGRHWPESAAFTTSSDDRYGRSASGYYPGSDHAGAG